MLVFAPIDRMVRVDLRQTRLEVPPQDIITRDNVTLKVNAVVFLRVIDPNRSRRGSRELSSTRVHSSPRPRCAPCSARRNSTSFWPTATS